MDRCCNSYIIRTPGEDGSPARCTKCNTDKPISSFYVHSHRGDGATRYRSQCKDCRRSGKRIYWARPVHAQILKTGIQSCKKCGETKPLSEFYANGCFPDGTKRYRSTCKLCVLHKLKVEQPRIYKSKSAKRSSSPKNFLAGALNHATRRKQHLGFNIDIGYLMQLYEKQCGKCALSGIEMTFSAGVGRTKTNISIDRIDSAKGYVRGNVQLVCDLVNRMKSDCSEEELYDFCEKIIRFRDEKI